MTLKAFSQAYHEWKYKDSTVPKYGLPFKSFSDSSANALTKAVLAYFEWKGIKAWRQSSEGRYLPEQKATNVIGQTITTRKGRFIPRSGGAVGIGDISAIVNGVFTSLEIKYGKDRQSDQQKHFQAEIEKSGGIYLIVRTWAGFIHDIEMILSHEKILKTPKPPQTERGLEF